MKQEFTLNKPVEAILQAIREDEKARVKNTPYVFRIPINQRKLIKKSKVDFPAYLKKCTEELYQELLNNNAKTD